MSDFPLASVEEGAIVDLLKQDLQFKQVWLRLVSKQVIERTAQERGITVTPDEIQAECDRLRREKHLQKAADTLAWLREQMASIEDLEAGLHHRLLSQKLAEHLFSQEVKKVFAQRKIDFDRILLYQILVADPRLAKELFYQIQEQEISFFEAAHLYDIDEKRRYNCGFEGQLFRWSLKPEIATVVFSIKPGELTRPLQTERGYHLFWVEKFIPAELTSERYQEILQTLFQEWLTSEVNYWLVSSQEKDCNRQEVEFSS